MTDTSEPSVRLRIVLSPGVGIGPGKAALLTGIRETGSIAAAGRRIGMSYKRAWLLVSALNSHFPQPLIEATKGGRSGGGARLTALGEDVLGAYRDMERLTEAAVSPLLTRIHALQSGRAAKPRKTAARPRKE